MNPSDVNWLAVLVAALATFLLGGLWYSPILFAKRWMELNGLEPSALQGGLARVFGGAFVLMLVAATNLAFFLGPEATLAFGVFAGAAAGVGWVAVAFGVVYLFERKPLALFLINAGYLAIAFTAMGAILGAWR